MAWRIHPVFLTMGSKALYSIKCIHMVSIMWDSQCLGKFGNFHSNFIDSAGIKVEKTLVMSGVEHWTCSIQARYAND